MESIKALIDNTVSVNTRTKFAGAILYAQTIIEINQYDQNYMSRTVAADMARIKFGLPEYFTPVLEELLRNHWNESEEYANSILSIK